MTYAFICKPFLYEMLQRKDRFSLPQDQAEAVLEIFPHFGERTETDVSGMDDSNVVIFSPTDEDLTQWMTEVTDLLALTNERLEANNFHLSEDEAWRTVSPSLCGTFIHAIIADHADELMPTLRTDKDYVAYMSGDDSNGRSMTRAISKMDDFVSKFYYHLVVTCRA